MKDQLLTVKKEIHVESVEKKQRIYRCLILDGPVKWQPRFTLIREIAETDIAQIQEGYLYYTMLLKVISRFLIS